MATKKLVTNSTHPAWRFESPAKPLSYREADSKYVGEEHVYPDLIEQQSWTKSEYNIRLMKALNWYSYTQDSKKSAEWLIQFLSRNPRRLKLAMAIKRGDAQVTATAGFAFRAGRVGLQLRFSTLRKLVKIINAVKITETISAVTEEKKSTPNIQERMAEKTSEFLGEVEGKFDEFMSSDFKGEPKLIDLMTASNVPVQQMKSVTEHINKRIAEFEEVLSSTDGQLIEAYKYLNKRQLKSMVTWWTQALTDVNSYGVIKKATKAPRKRKAVPPEKIVSKMSYCKEFAELSLKSINPTAILTASELWVFNTKTRKLGIYIADAHASALSVKGTRILGFDAAASVQKTLRKPKEQLKEWTSNGKPAAKKWFKGVRSTEIKLNGRINDDVILLKVYK
jgi:hypothetical protein